MTEMKVLPRDIVDRFGPETKQFATEDIIAAGYRLELYDAWEGIPLSEVEFLKGFLEDLAPFLPTLVGEAHSLLKSLQKKKRLSESKMDKLLGPGVYFSRRTKFDVAYHVRLTWDNVVFLDREEGIYVRSKEYERPNSAERPEGFSFSSFHVTRNVGELHPVATDV